MSLEPSEEPTRQGTLFGDYEVLDELGVGGSGVVYRAHHAGLHRTVALKLMRDALFATERERERFRNGAASAAELDHPHIVPIFHVGERDGQPFFTMRLIEGENLANALPRLCKSTEGVVRILAKVARAVHFAHQRGILHRDLKPANILLDDNDEPYVADFGLAKRLDAGAAASKSSGIVGTLGYMSPEQAKGVAELTPAADVYALGVILFELLTESLPLPEGSTFEQLSWLTSPKPPRLLRELKPSIDRNLEVICLKCLQKDPEKRYQTAESLAVALERAIRREEDEPLPPWSERLEAWARRHPRRSLTVASLLVLLALASLGRWWLWRQERRAVQDALETNAFIAGSQAGAVLAQLREYAERVDQTAREPEVVRLAAAGFVGPSTPLRLRLGDFDNLTLLDNEGAIVATWPPPLPIAYERRYAFRDYFRGARYLAEHRLPGAYVARAYVSETQGHLVFAFSAPLLDPQGTAIGILMATVHAKSMLGAIKMEDSAGGRHVTSALIGPRGPDRDTKSGALCPDYTFLVHPGLPDGREYRVSSPLSAQLRKTFGASAPPGQQFALQYVAPVKVSEYEDAVPGFQGPWLAAFAPVGNTGFVVLVQTRRR